MAETLSTLSIVAFISAGVFFLFAAFFWFFFRIPSVIGDLSGRTARKSIAKMRMANEKSGLKSYKTSKTNASRGKLTSEAGEETNASREKNLKRPETGVLEENREREYITFQTEKMSEDSTERLDVNFEDMSGSEEETMPLNLSGRSGQRRDRGVQLAMIEQVMIIHTDEVI